MNAWHIAAIVCFGGSCLTLYGMQSSPEVAIPFFTALSVASLFCGYMGMSDKGNSTTIRDSYNTTHHHHYAARVQAQVAEIERLKREMDILKREHRIRVQHQPIVEHEWLPPIHEDINRPGEIVADDARPIPAAGFRGVLQSIARGAAGGQQALPKPQQQAVALVRQTGKAVSK